MKGRQADEARERDAVPVAGRGPFRAERQRVGHEVVADDLGDAGQPALVVLAAGQIVEADRGRAFEREVDGGVRHGEAADRIGHGARLGAVALQELQPRRRGGEEIAHLDGRSGLA